MLVRTCVCARVRVCMYIHAYHVLCLLKACTPFDLQTPLLGLNSICQLMLHTSTVAEADALQYVINM